MSCKTTSSGVLDPLGQTSGQQVERLPDNLNDEQLKHGARKQCEDGL